MATAEDAIDFISMMNEHGFTSYRRPKGRTILLLYALIGLTPRKISNGALVDVVPAVDGATHHPRRKRHNHHVRTSAATFFRLLVASMTASAKALISWAGSNLPLLLQSRPPDSG